MTDFWFGVLTGVLASVFVYTIAVMVADARISARRSRIEL